nr:type I toxin-antitoxin system Fst family toxin [Ligilactobacillus pabuli]
MLQDLFSIIIAPILVGISKELFFRWLDEKDEDNDR